MTWTDISGDLPNAPVNDVVIAGSDLFAATDVGVFVTRDGGTTWLRLGGNLPAVPVMDLRVHTGTQTLTAATFGHGIQRVDLPVAAPGSAATGSTATGTTSSTETEVLAPVVDALRRAPLTTPRR